MRSKEQEEGDQVFIFKTSRRELINSLFFHQNYLCLLPAVPRRAASAPVSAVGPMDLAMTTINYYGCTGCCEKAGQVGVRAAFEPSASFMPEAS